MRSSYACEVFATEFEVQGLELDWIGLCWGGDFIWSGHAWLPRAFHYTAAPPWRPLKQPDDQEFRRNAYRVLLTRARQGMILYIPTGDPADPTRSPAELDRTADYLLTCGVQALAAPPKS